MHVVKVRGETEFFYITKRENIYAGKLRKKIFFEKFFNINNPEQYF